jgi:hypothetical protein
MANHPLVIKLVLLGPRKRLMQCLLSRETGSTNLQIECRIQQEPVLVAGDFAIRCGLNQPTEQKRINEPNF